MAYRALGTYIPAAGMGTCCDSCAHGGPCSGMGFTAPDFSQTGLFNSGMDWTGWGYPEWITVGIGAYVLISVFSTTARVGRKAAHVVGSPVRVARKLKGYAKSRRSAKAAELRKRAKELDV